MEAQLIGRPGIVMTIHPHQSHVDSPSANMNFDALEMSMAKTGNEVLSPPSTETNGPASSTSKLIPSPAPVRSPVRDLCYLLKVRHTARQATPPQV